MLITKVADPSRLNASELANRFWDSACKTKGEVKIIDIAQDVLDGLVRDGILATE